ncbi:MAG: hypothetical protein M1548_03285 [Actinobacteria bacterium]|nr:hypothetical protein [Actinomycetota bacterium]
MANNEEVLKGEEGESQDKRGREIRLYLERVHCADCVRDLIEGVVTRVEGVKGARFEEADLCLVVEGTEVDEAMLRSAITAVGYSFRDAGAPVNRPSRLANGVYIAIAVVLLILLVLWLQRV